MQIVHDNSFGPDGGCMSPERLAASAKAAAHSALLDTGFGTLAELMTHAQGGGATGEFRIAEALYADPALQPAWGEGAGGGGSAGSGAGAVPRTMSKKAAKKARAKARAKEKARSEREEAEEAGRAASAPQLELLDSQDDEVEAFAARLRLPAVDGRTKSQLLQARKRINAELSQLAARQVELQAELTDVAAALSAKA